MAFLAALESASPAFCKMPATFIDSNSPKQWTRKKNQEPKNEILLPKNRIILPWPTYTEPRPKRGRLENQSQDRQWQDQDGKTRKKHPKESKLYRTAWTHVWIWALREVDLKPIAKRGTNRARALVNLYWLSWKLAS